MIAIVDYGMGNLGSIENMLKKLKVPCIITNKEEEIIKADKLILPGVGAFGKAMDNIELLNLKELLNSKVILDQTPTLGICLGMQLLATWSEEGDAFGFGWIDGKIIKFDFEDKSKLKVPHMGWNTVNIVNNDFLFQNMEEEIRFYFVHSFYMKCDDPSVVIGSTYYGHDFTSIVKKDNIYGAQFHPEKSHKYGMRLLHNFSKIKSSN